MKAHSVDISVGELARYLHGTSVYIPAESCEDEAFIDVRIQIHDGSWQFHSGSSDYDQDHRGVWAASSVQRGVTLKECHTLARDMIRECGGEECYDDCCTETED